MRKYLLILIILFFSSPIFSAETPINLILHHFVPPTHSPHKNMLVPWAREVEKLSKYKVRITIAPKMSLGGKPGDLIKQVEKGKVDLVDLYMQRINKKNLKSHITTNKWLYNYQYASIIASQIPNSKIIHCYRNPLDNICLLYTSPSPRD